MGPNGADQRDGSEPGTFALLGIGAVLGVVLRGVTWVLSSFTVGPLFGLADLAAIPFTDRRELLFAQAAGTVVAVLSVVLAGLGLQTDPGRYRRLVRLLCAVFIVDTVVYLAPVVYVATMDLGITTAVWALFGVTVVGNLGLAGLCVQIMYRTRRLRGPAAAAPATPVTAPPNVAVVLPAE